MAKTKFYVVWTGRKPGIYKTWDDCQKQVKGFKGAQFKSFKTESEAKSAYYGVEEEVERSYTSTYIKESISVDAACSGNPGVMEYQCVDTETEKQLFHVGPFSKGTNNIGEFLGIVDGIKYLQKQNKNIPIYTDSQTAMAWVRNKKANTKLVKDEETKELWDKVDEAIDWLKNNTYDIPIYKWKTEEWGEIKADFGRK